MEDLPMFKQILLVCMVITSPLVAVSWENQTGKTVQTIFYQGNRQSQMQAAQRTGLKGFTATTSQYVSCGNPAKCLELIHNCYIGCEIEEVKLAPVHGSVSLKDKFMQGINRQVFKACSIKASKPNGPLDVSTHSIDMSKVNIGQQGDLDNHKKKYELCCKEHPEDDIILFGVSRGAATTFSAVACNMYDSRKVKLVVLEGCFDSLFNLIAAWPFFKWLSKSEALHHKFYTIVPKVYPSYQQHGINPLANVKQFAQQGIPVVFITSKTDKTVPYQCTMRLAHATAQAGATVYVIELQNSSHAGYCLSNNADRQNYQNILHAIYKRHNLPYITEYAQKGECLVKGCVLNAA
jgi:hypothetical protein